MQSTSSIYTDSLHLQLSWKTKHKHHYYTTIPKHPKPRNLSLSNSLKTSSYGFELKGVDREEKPDILCLPVAIKKSGKVSRYLWDGTHLKLVSFDDTTSNWFEFDDGFRKFYQFCSSTVLDFFIPQQVPENYIDYVKWKFLHRVFSSALQVLATQAMFRAMGVGYYRSLPSAAALNWVLKDGLGRLSRCIYTASLASAFDTNLKRVRFSTSIMFSLSMGVELLTPVFPHYFLLLATVANIAKQISLACYLATGDDCCNYSLQSDKLDDEPPFELAHESAVHRSFAIADNLGEVSAKAQIQTVCFDNLGLMLAALLNILCKNNQRLQASLPFIVYPIFSAIDLFGIYQALKNVHLQTLTKDRLEIILDTWLQLGSIPSPAKVSKEEGIDLPWGKGSELWPIRIGCVNPKDPIPKFSMLAMRSLRKEDFYFICMETCPKGFRTNEHGILLCLREGAGVTDIIMGLLQACHIRSTLLSRNRWEHILEANYISDSDISEWFKVVEDSKRCTNEEVELLKEQLRRSGWSVKNILLSVQEQVRYSLLDD